MERAKQQFGGDWTDQKLDRIRKYLKAYTTIMAKTSFRTAYIDAFAGTGYRETVAADSLDAELLCEVLEPDCQDLSKGSARIALEIRPCFHEYIFVERSALRLKELERLKLDHSEMAGNIELVNADANTYLFDLCSRRDWTRHGAVVFLDPYGMQVKWGTIEAIAGTKAIDMWLLFPLGVAVNRLLKRDGQIPPEWQTRLDEIFGSHEWYEEFYKVIKEPGLLGDQEVLRKVSDFTAIERYFVARLKTVFAAVAEKPLALRNSANCPLFLLCFAAGNPRGAPIAVKIAQYLLKE